MKKAKRQPPDTPRGRDGLLGPTLQRYFCGYLIGQRQLSPATIASYRDTFRLLLAFLERSSGCKPDRVSVRDLNAQRVLDSLDDLEATRHNGARSRNARLAAIRSFMRHAAAADPLLLSVAQPVLAIPVKRFERAIVKHLSRAQMHALLNAPNESTRAGFRDRVLLTLMYNTGARVSEIAAFNVGDLRLATGGSIHVRGKGRKQRTVSLWRESVRLLRRWLRHLDSPLESPLLPNARGARMTRSGVEHHLHAAVESVAVGDPAMRRLRISPHAIRHTTAMHLLQSGVDLSVIAMWLGHESIQTTHQYLDADLDSKRRALNHLQAPKVKLPGEAAPERLLQFLRGL